MPPSVGMTLLGKQWHRKGDDHESDYKRGYDGKDEGPNVFCITRATAECKKVPNSGVHSPDTYGMWHVRDGTLKRGTVDSVPKTSSNVILIACK